MEAVACVVQRGVPGPIRASPHDAGTCVIEVGESTTAVPLDGVVMDAGDGIAVANVLQGAISRLVQCLLSGKRATVIVVGEDARVKRDAFEAAVQHCTRELTLLTTRSGQNGEINQDIIGIPLQLRMGALTIAAGANAESEDVRDALAIAAGALGELASSPGRPHRLRDDPVCGPYLPGAWEAVIGQVPDAEALLDVASDSLWPPQQAKRQHICVTLTLYADAAVEDGIVSPSAPRRNASLSGSVSANGSGGGTFVGRMTIVHVDAAAPPSVASEQRRDGRSDGGVMRPLRPQQPFVPQWVRALAAVMAAVEARAPTLPFGASTLTSLLRPAFIGMDASVLLAVAPNEAPSGPATLQFAARLRAIARILSGMLSGASEAPVSVAGTAVRDSMRRDRSPVRAASRGIHGGGEATRRRSETRPQHQRIWQGRNGWVSPPPVTSAAHRTPKRRVAQGAWDESMLTVSPMPAARPHTPIITVGSHDVNSGVNAQESHGGTSRPRPFSPTAHSRVRRLGGGAVVAMDSLADGGGYTRNGGTTRESGASMEMPLILAAAGTNDASFSLAHDSPSIVGASVSPHIVQVPYVTRKEEGHHHDREESPASALRGMQRGRLTAAGDIPSATSTRLYVSPLIETPTSDGGNDGSAPSVLAESREAPPCGSESRHNSPPANASLISRSLGSVSSGLTSRLLVRSGERVSGDDVGKAGLAGGGKSDYDTPKRMRASQTSGDDDADDTVRSQYSSAGPSVEKALRRSGLLRRRDSRDFTVVRDTEIVTTERSVVALSPRRSMNSVNTARSDTFVGRRLRTTELREGRDHDTGRTADDYVGDQEEDALVLPRLATEKCGDASLPEEVAVAPSPALQQNAASPPHRRAMPGNSVAAPSAAATVASTIASATISAATTTALVDVVRALQSKVRALETERDALSASWAQSREAEAAARRLLRDAERSAAVCDAALARVVEEAARAQQERDAALKRERRATAALVRGRAAQADADKCAAVASAAAQAAKQQLEATAGDVAAANSLRRQLDEARATLSETLQALAAARAEADANKTAAAKSRALCDELDAALADERRRAAGLAAELMRARLQAAVPGAAARASSDAVTRDEVEGAGPAGTVMSRTRGDRFEEHLAVPANHALVADGGFHAASTWTRALRQDSAHGDQSDAARPRASSVAPAGHSSSSQVAEFSTPHTYSRPPRPQRPPPRSPQLKQQGGAHFEAYTIPLADEVERQVDHEENRGLAYRKGQESNPTQLSRDVPSARRADKAMYASGHYTTQQRLTASQAPQHLQLQHYSTPKHQIGYGSSVRREGHLPRGGHRDVLHGEFHTASAALGSSHSHGRQGMSSHGPVVASHATPLQVRRNRH